MKIIKIQSYQNQLSIQLLHWPLHFEYCIKLLHFKTLQMNNNSLEREPIRAKTEPIMQTVNIAERSKYVLI